MKSWQQSLIEGVVIPACPLALDENGVWNSRYQRALIRYYLSCGAGGVAVGVHTTQFEIRQHGLLEPVLKCIADTIDQKETADQQVIRVAGLCGDRRETIAEAGLASELGFQLGLLSPSLFSAMEENQIVEHTRAIAEIIPVFGFYLQPAVGGRVLSYDYWRRLAEIENLRAIKVAAFNRYQTIDVMRAVEESQRSDLVVYTGNDDNIIADLLTPYCFSEAGEPRWMAGGLLGQWAVWTRQAVEMLEAIKQVRKQKSVDLDWLSRNIWLTDTNAAIFDASNEFAGCIAGVNEVLRRQGLLPSNRCLNPKEALSPGQSEEIDRIGIGHEEEDAWITSNLDRWLED